MPTEERIVTLRASLPGQVRARRRRSWQKIALFGAALVAMLGGIVLAGLYSARATRTLGHVTRRSMHASTGRFADRIVRTVEKRIIDQDRALIDLCDLQDLNDFRVFWDRLTTMSSLVEGALVLDERMRIVHYASKEDLAQRRNFTRLFTDRIAPAMRLHDLRPGEHKHLHTRIQGHDYLISYMFKEHRGRRFLVALKINLAYVVRVVLPEELGALGGRYVAAVVDQDRRVRFGRPVPPGLRNVQVERRFPTTLYRWRVVLAPRDAAAVAREAERRHHFNLVLVVASLVAVLLGFGTLVWGLRREQVVAQMKSDFVSAATHELKTPITLVRMYAELLTMEQAGAVEKRAEYAAVLVRETERLVRLIDGILDLARFERGRAEMKAVVVDLGPLLREAVSRVAGGPLGERATFDLALPEEPAWALINPDAMHLALLNLLENAVKYGGGRVTVGLRPEAEAWELEVADDGPGIPEPEREQMFERFYRGSRARETKEHGSGIGLAVVKAVVEAQGGTITVGNGPAGGACFRLRLPRHAPAARPAGEAKASAR